CSASKESQDGEVSVQVMASPAPDSPASAYNELQLQSDHIDETEDSVQPFSTTGEALKCTEELEDAEDGDLDGSPASYTEGHLQTEQDSRAEETIMPSSATQQIVSAFFDTSAQVGVQVETSPDGDTLSSFTTEKDSHKVKDNRAEEAFLSSSATKQSLKKTRDVPNTELGYKGDSSLHPSPASKGTETDKRIKMALGLIQSPLVYDGDAHEFLICVLDLMRSLSPEMQLTAANLGLTYTCPVVEHIALQMLNTRTCRRYECTLFTLVTCYIS
ncbi:hypothetical protein XENOCAPTIV_009558, partial [Xenoophorus captivus]